ncbi:MAG TPA: hypothetical protein VJ323_21000, partial [Bryobacteraceae bacterium]|nr:hypothetical protein [Bryobacteraceae bacterium]
EPYAEDQDGMHASDIYSKLENEIVPLYYESREQGVPVEWVRRMKQSLAAITPRFSCGRMVAEYMYELYEPAHKLWERASRDDFRETRRKSEWETKLANAWSRIHFVGFGDGPAEQVLSGSPVPLRTEVDLAGLQPSDVRVEAVVGRIGPNGQLQDIETLPLSAVGQNGDAFVFASEYVVQQTGLVGYSLRISPNHFENPLTRPCNALLKWGSDS